MPGDPVLRDHKAWLGYLQPDGLVVSAVALADAQVVLNENAAPLQRRFLEFVDTGTERERKAPELLSLRDALLQFLEWPADCLYGVDAGRPIPEELKIPLQEYGETLEPAIALEDPDPATPEARWILLAQEAPSGRDLDSAPDAGVESWTASPTRRLERLLREARVPIGLLSNGRQIRLVYAPRGENTGTLTFPVGAMTETAGRSILSAFDMLLSKYRLLSAPREARLPALLEKSRQYQTLVSTKLAEQVLDALYELLRGLQVADTYTHGDLLRKTLAEQPNEIYSGLLNVLMRLVFLLYSEDRGLLPTSELYVRNYSVHGLFERLRKDAEEFIDTMDHRYGAWAQLVALFRTVYDGCKHRHIAMPARRGHLFDPDRYPFLEGRTTDEGHLPLLSDGVLYRVLDRLLILDGERLSYRTLDVEQIGSVYETMMGFRLERTGAQTIALKPGKASGAPTPVSLEELAGTAAANRAKWIKERTDYGLPAKMTAEVKNAQTIDELLVALERRIARNATPQPIPAGTMVLVPTDERRKTGSHYTPRSLTEPIVRTTLEPVLAQLGAKPKPEQILDLKICDPAMGSGAFLVEACRQLADELIKAWANHGLKPYIPSDEDEVLFARRLIAQRCLYGVDKNPMAVDLAKLSLWLATLAKDHPFTFVDHALRCGDSLVGLTRKQIAALHWKPSRTLTFLETDIEGRIKRAGASRREILEAGDDMPPETKRQRLAVADDTLSHVRLLGDAVIAAFFAGSSAAERQEKRAAVYATVQAHYSSGDVSALLALDAAAKKPAGGARVVRPLHWEIEFSEVFGRGTPGFDVFVGNPPFMSSTTAWSALGPEYRDWLRVLHERSEGRAVDLVAHFFRRAFGMLRLRGAFGLVATNTIGQGDTRLAGLHYICQAGGRIYSVTTRRRWPGAAAVLVSVVHVSKRESALGAVRNGVRVSGVNSFLLPREGEADPKPLRQNDGLSFHGSKIYGEGFTFDDAAPEGLATPIAEMRRLVAKDPRNAERIFPYVGGDDLNTEPTQRHRRYVIGFGRMTEQEARAWPDLVRIVEDRVRPYRSKMGGYSLANRRRTHWWQFETDAMALHGAIGELDRCLAVSRHSANFGIAFQPTNVIFADSLVVFALGDYASFALLQARPHEFWARFLGSSLGDDLRYNPTDCFQTLPLPPNWRASSALEAAGKAYHEFRAALMVRNDEGLTKTYNRFHDPDETSADIVKVRELHAAMDRAVLDAYGWTDIQPTCEFLLDYEEDEEDGETSRRKKPWRYRWPDEVRDEVLARLLALNAERAEEERRAGAAVASKDTGRSRKKKETLPDGERLIGDAEEEDDA